MATRNAIVAASVGAAVEVAGRSHDALCILALGVVLFIAAGIFEDRRRRK